jgi:hypothetical protein
MYPHPYMKIPSKNFGTTSTTFPIAFQKLQMTTGQCFSRTPGACASLIVNQAASKGCLMKLKYSYGVASESTASSPCSNVPIHCPLSPKSDPAIWRYFFKIHFQQKRPNAPFTKYEDIWKLTIVLPKFGSVRFLTPFLRTENWTDGP